jgi:hypothetical protein
MEVLLDAAAHSKHGILFWFEIGAKQVERSELECLIWWIANREHKFKLEYKIKQ